MRALKVYFLGRLLREKAMLVLLVAIAALWWASSFTSRGSARWREHHTLVAKLAEQKRWLQSRGVIEAAAVQAVKNLDPAQTLDDTRLVGELSALAREQNLKFTNDAPQTDRTGQFAVHTVQLSLQRAEWEALERFSEALAKRSPYLGVTQFSVVADRANPVLLNASLQVSSVEIVRP